MSNYIERSIDEVEEAVDRVLAEHAELNTYENPFDLLRTRQSIIEAAGVSQ